MDPGPTPSAPEPGGLGHRAGRRGLDRRRALPRVQRRSRPHRVGRHRRGPGPSLPRPRGTTRRRRRIVDLDLSERARHPVPRYRPVPAGPVPVHRQAAMPSISPNATSMLFYCLRGPATARSSGAGGTRRIAVGARRRRHRFPVGPSPAPGRTGGGPVPRRRLAAARLSRAWRPPRPGSPPHASTASGPAPGWPRWPPTPTPPRRSRVAVLLGNARNDQTLTATHTLWAMLGVLPEGHVQRPHRHQSIALDLIVTATRAATPWSGPRSEPDGTIVDPVRVEWEPGGAFVTPPGAVAQPPQRIRVPRQPVAGPGRRAPHLSPHARHPLHDALISLIAGA